MSKEELATPGLRHQLIVCPESALLPPSMLSLLEQLGYVVCKTSMERLPVLIREVLPNMVLVSNSSDWEPAWREAKSLSRGRGSEIAWVVLADDPWGDDIPQVRCIASAVLPATLPASRLIQQVSQLLMRRSDVSGVRPERAEPLSGIRIS